LTFTHTEPRIRAMSPLIEIKSRQGEKPFKTKVVEISPETAAEIAADISMANLILNAKVDPVSDEEREKLAIALAEASRES